jgi:hypothetical protein
LSGSPGWRIAGGWRIARAGGGAGRAAANLQLVPMEGHWQRVNTPLRRLSGRERGVAVAAVAITAVALIALVLTTVGNSRPALPRGCISAIVPGATGGASVEACGTRARSLCAIHATQEDPGSQAIKESCRRAGIG